MKKLLENKLVVGGVCIVIAAILAFLVLPGMYKQKEKTIYTVSYTHLDVYKRQIFVNAPTI